MTEEKPRENDRYELIYIASGFKSSEMTPDEERISAPVLRQAACLSQGEPRQQRTDAVISPSGKGIVESLLGTRPSAFLGGQKSELALLVSKFRGARVPLFSPSFPISLVIGRSWIPRSERSEWLCSNLLERRPREGGRVRVPLVESRLNRDNS